MSIAHFANLGKLLAERANTVTVANGYTFERTAVVRRTLDQQTTYVHGVIEILELDPTAELDVNASLSQSTWKGWTQDFLITVCVVQSNASVTPITDEVGFAARDVLKALALSDRLQGQTHTIDCVTIEQHRAEPGSIGGVIFHVRATYQTKEDDLGAVPYLPIFWSE